MVGQATVKRYLKIVLHEEDVLCWERGLYVVAYWIRHEKELHRLHGWPDLEVAEQIDPWTWRLLFVWPEQPMHILTPHSEKLTPGQQADLAWQAVRPW